MMKAERIEIFVSYAHKDEKLRQGLEKQLKALQRRGLIDVWYDREIGAGTEWEREIDRHLSTAQIILLLISPDFMDSDYCYSIEMKQAMEQHKRGEARVIPIILRPTDWQIPPLDKLQALPNDAKPVTMWQNRDAGFLNVAQGLRKVVEVLTRKSSIQPAIPEQTDDQDGILPAPNYLQHFGWYNRAWSRDHRGLFLLLLDQSDAMNETVVMQGHTFTLAQVTTAIINSLLFSVIQKSSPDLTTYRRKDFCDFIVFGYGDRVTPLLNTTGSPVPLPDLAERPRGLRRVHISRYDALKGQAVPIDREEPYWIEPYANGAGTEMSSVISRAYQTIQQWLKADSRRHQSFPPMVINITGGRYMGGRNSNFVREAALLRQLHTDDGAVLLFNCYIGQSSTQSLAFPSNVGQIKNLGLTDEERLCAEQLFEISSIVPAPMAAQAEGIFRVTLPFGARGFLCNAGGVELIDFLSWGTRPRPAATQSQDIHIWPTIQEYDSALREASTRVRDPDIKHRTLLQDASGPVHLNWRKGSVCVYKFDNWIVKCFTGTPPADIRERYLAISEYFSRHTARLSSLIFQQWIEDGIWINHRNWPFIKSEYIQHIPLGTFLRDLALSQNKDQTLVLKLAKQWLDMITLLESLNIAHGDFDITNVLVCGTPPDITLRLIDFDCMYVPALAGRQLWELGHEHFQPPQSSVRHFNNEMDRFSVLVIYLSLIALAEDPLLWERCRADNDDKLLLGADDFRNLATSKAFQLLREKQNNLELQKCLTELALSITELRMPRSLSEVLSSPATTNPPLLSEPEQLNVIPTGQPQLPPLFTDDPLYAIPRPTKARLFIKAKGNAPLVDCENACTISSDETRAAVCEGYGTFARPWAALVSQQWIEQPWIAADTETLGKWLNKPRALWEQWIYNTWLPIINIRNRGLGRREFSPQDTENFIALGATSTFLGIMVNQKETNWSAVAIGDTCLFHFSRVDNNVWVFKSFPPSSSHDFTSEPASISSRTGDFPQLFRHVRSTRGTYTPGDVLVMATDALALWIFKQIEQRTIGWPKLLDLNSPRDFSTLLDQERARGQINDTDTTLLIIPL